MPRNNPKGGYTGSSCFRCHKQKVKCSKGMPCRNCAASNRPCTYAVRDRKVTVQESYLRRLEGGLMSPRTLVPQPNQDRFSQQGPSQAEGSDSSRRSVGPLVANSTTELFVSKLKQIQRLTPSGMVDLRQDSIAPSDDSAERQIKQPPLYEYFALSFDTSHPECTFKLPPYPYAIHLLNLFTTYFGHDWHWFRLKTFRQRLDRTYMTIDSAEAKDRLWLCQLLVVFAHGETAGVGLELEVRLDPNNDSSQSFVNRSVRSSNPPPGMKFFEQALRLLNVPYEEPSIGHIETLILIALYSYSLNRQKTAYMYAGAGARMCNMLQLHQASLHSDLSPAEREHRKRLWWSTYCIDQMASLQMGLLPALRVEQADLDYPTQAGLPPDDVEEFADPELLAARIQLTILQSDIANRICQLGHDNSQEFDTVIRPMLQRLNAWRTCLPAHLALELADGIPEAMRKMPSIRSLANSSLRINQCIIILLRPLLLKQIASIFSNEEYDASLADLNDLNNTCLRAARSSLRILIDIRTCGLLVRLGFMENLHLFTSLMILSLSMSINARRPGSFDEMPDNTSIYAAGKEVLRDMIHAGSLPAKAYERMLKDVEALGVSLSTNDGVGSNPAAVQWDVDEWMTQLFESENFVNF